MGGLIVDTTIRIFIITDKKELNRKGHDKPVVELYNDISCELFKK
jgi:hypothetical protein